MEKLTAILEMVGNPKNQHDKTDEILGNYYSSFNNMVKRNQLGIDPIQAQIDAIENIKSKEEIPALIAAQHKLGIRSLFGFGVGQDLKDVENNIVSLGQGGIGMPNRGYYFSEDKEEIKAAYGDYIASVMAMLNKENHEKVASQVLDFETQLAEAMMTPSEMRIPENRYHKTSFKEAIDMFGAFNFEGFITETGIRSFESMNVSNPKHAKQINSMFETVSLEEWKNYLLWMTMNHYAGHLDQNYVELNFNFYGTTLSGTKSMKPINERSIDEITNMEFGELLGKAFVEQHYSSEAQDQVNKLVDNLLVVFQERIKNLEWMSEETKVKDLLKLN
jgi:predicted metalloendopeptidase